MITIPKFDRILAVLLTAAIFVSCNDDDNTADFTVIGDVFTTKKTINEEVQYARSYYAYGNQPMSAAKVTTPNASEITLTAANSIGNTWHKAASNGDFSTTVPTEGNYQFDVLHEDVPHEAFDILKIEDLPFSTITTNTVENSTLTVEWEGSAESEGHTIRLLSTNDEIIYASQLLSSEAIKLIIDPSNSSGTWLDGYPNIGDTYKLELHAFLFDSEASDLDRTYNIEVIAISEDEVIWE